MNLYFGAYFHLGLLRRILEGIGNIGFVSLRVGKENNIGRGRLWGNRTRSLGLADICYLRFVRLM